MITLQSLMYVLEKSFFEENNHDNNGLHVFIYNFIYDTIAISMLYILVIHSCYIFQVKSLMYVNWQPLT